MEKQIAHPDSELYTRVTGGFCRERPSFSLERREVFVATLLHGKALIPNLWVLYFSLKCDEFELMVSKEFSD